MDVNKKREIIIIFLLLFLYDNIYLGNYILFYLDLGGFQLPCYVLEDGTIVLSGRKMQETLKIVDGNTSGTKLPQFFGNFNA